MALSTTIIKKSITSGQDGLFQITLNLLYKDGDTVLIDEDFTENYWRSDPWSVLTGNFRERMKARIARYKEEQVVFATAGLTAGVANLNSTVGT